MTIKDTMELAENLKDKGLKVAPYHANLEPELRSRIHRKWTENIYQVVHKKIGKSGDDSEMFYRCSRVNEANFIKRVKTQRSLIFFTLGVDSLKDVSAA